MRNLFPATFSLLALSSHLAHGQIEWIPGDGNWNDPLRWVGGAVPTAATDATLDTGHTAIVDSDSAADILRVSDDDAPARIVVDLTGSGTFTTHNAYFCVNSGTLGFANLDNGTWNNSNQIDLGVNGQALAELRNEFALTTNALTVGVGPSAIGNLILGDDSSLATLSTGSASVVIGSGGQGTATLSGNANLHSGGDISIGYFSGGNGTIDVTGGSLSAHAMIHVGSIGSGSLSLSGTGSASSAFLWSGSADGSQGSISLSGNSSLDVGDTISIGRDGGGTASISLSENSTVSSLNTYLGTFGTSQGTATLSGGSWTNTGSYHVGFAGASSGDLSLSGNASLNVDGELIIGNNSSGSNTLALSDTANITAGNFILGYTSGSGTATLNGGAITTTSLFTIIGRAGNATLTLNSGSSINTQTFIIGDEATSTSVVNLNSGSTLTATGISTNASSSSTFNFNGGKIRVDSTAGLFFTNFKSGELNLMSGGLEIEVTSGNALITSSNTGGFSGGGALTKSGEGILRLSSASNHTGGTVLNAGGLILLNENSIGTGPITINGGTLFLGNHEGNQDIHLNGGGVTTGTYSGTIHVGGNASVFHNMNFSTLDLGDGSHTVDTDATDTFPTLALPSGLNISMIVGSGTLTGSELVTIYDRLSPGQSAGSIEFELDLTLDGATLFSEIAISSNLATGSFDLVTIQGILRLQNGAALELAALDEDYSDPFWLNDQTIAFLDYDDISGDFSSIDLTAINSGAEGYGEWSVERTSTAYNAIWTAVPEPSVFFLGAASVLALAMRRRRG